MQILSVQEPDVEVDSLLVMLCCRLSCSRSKIFNSSDVKLLNKSPVLLLCCYSSLHTDREQFFLKETLTMEKHLGNICNGVDSHKS